MPYRWVYVFVLHGRKALHRFYFILIYILISLPAADHFNCGQEGLFRGQDALYTILYKEGQEMGMTTTTNPNPIRAWSPSTSTSSGTNNIHCCIVAVVVCQKKKNPINGP